MKIEIVGIDVSKLTLDVWLHKKQQHKSFSNNEKGFKQLVRWVLNQSETSDFSELAFCYENTGLYSLPLSIYFHNLNACYFQVSGLLVKRSLGLIRGKNDKVDAKNLARFAFLHFHELKPYKLPSENILQLKQLLSFREKMVRQRKAHKAYLHELKNVLNTDKSAFVIQTTVDTIAFLNEKVNTVEKEMLALIKADEALVKTHKLVTSIKGVGMIVSATMIVYTNNFEAFDDWRKFACYSGTAPFEHQSGSSIRGRTRVSSLGNRALKTLLSMSAASAIQYNPEMKLYYRRRLQDGKNKMSTLNIIRNKILSRIFAVVHRQTPYVDLNKFAA
jgi:transposase